MASSTAKVLSAHARHVTAAKTSDAASAEATDVTSAKAAHVAAATAVSSAAATTGLGTSGNKAAGKHGTCQNHHHSSSHDILLWDGREIPPQDLVSRWRVPKTNAGVAMDLRWECLFALSTKFRFNHPDRISGAARTRGKRRRLTVGHQTEGSGHALMIALSA
jgi:hypothetical protein